MTSKENQWVEKWATFVVGPRQKSAELSTTIDTSISSINKMDDEEEVKESIQQIK